MNAANVSTIETAKFDKLAARWWDPNGESRPLHDLNPARLNYIAQRVALQGARVLDVGCGGGILSESLAAAGADVTGIDLAPRVLEVARLHLHESGLRVEYCDISVELLATEMPGAFDVIACMELLEHVPDPGRVIGACATLLKTGGTLVRIHAQSHAAGVCRGDFRRRIRGQPAAARHASLCAVHPPVGAGRSPACGGTGTGRLEWACVQPDHAPGENHAKYTSKLFGLCAKAMTVIPAWIAGIQTAWTPCFHCRA